MRQTLKKLVPHPLLLAYRELRRRRLARDIAGKTPSEVFSLVYARRLWGMSGESKHPFCSGSGSSEPRVVDAYVAAVTDWLGGFPVPPSVGDLGCGDFRVGSRIRRSCGTYTAYDCVAALLESNRRHWQGLDVRFELLDLCAASPAPADVFVIRQVLQHLSNDQIRRALENVVRNCTWLVVAEHVPVGQFTPNLDKPIGPDVRLAANSGIVLTAPPFNLRPAEEKVLCRTPVGQGEIVTVAYLLT